MKKSRLKWRVIWVIYCIPGTFLAIPMLILTYTLMPLGWLAGRMGNLKNYLIRKYKP